jgi:selenocysteine lyase/cysteine desulfurase
VRPLLDFLSRHRSCASSAGTGHRSRADRGVHAEKRKLAQLAERLAAAKLGVGVGNFYAYRLLQALGIDTDDGAVRASFVHYTSKEEVGRLIETLRKLLA